MRTAFLMTAVLLAAACEKPVQPFGVAHVDQGVDADSVYPVAFDPSRVGSFAGRSKSGAGYFYDEVLEYRVWFHPERGAKDVALGEDYFAAFARFEAAEEYSRVMPGAEEPLVLVRQLEWIDEPQPGQFVVKRGERITEWLPAWLPGSKRSREAIKEFLAGQPKSQD